MITLTTEQAQLIEDALENWFAQTPDTSHLDIKLFVLDTKQALSIIRAARAHEQAEQEPVAWVEVERGIPMFANFSDKYKPNGDGFIPLYAAPVRTKDLTDDEIHKCDRATVTRQDFARAVIAADREKNK